MKKIYVLAAIIFVAIGGAIWYFGQPKQESVAPPAATSFQECVDAGYPVAESYPRQCRTPDGRNFVEDIGNALEKQDIIRASNPRPNQGITSSVRI